MDKVKKHEYVQDNDEAKPIIIKALTFLYELDEIGKREIEVKKISNYFCRTKKRFFSGIQNRLPHHLSPSQGYRRT